MGVEFSQPCSQSARRAERVGAGGHSRSKGESGVSVLGGGTGFWGKLRTGQRVRRLGARRRRDGGRGVRDVAGSWKTVPESSAVEVTCPKGTSCKTFGVWLRVLFKIRPGKSPLRGENMAKLFFSGRKILAEFPPFLKGGNFSKSRREQPEVGFCWRGLMSEELEIWKLGRLAGKYDG